MKKTLTIAILVAAVLCASCSKVERVPEAFELKQIAFDSYSHLSTKAGVSTVSSINTFNVEAFHNLASGAVEGFFSATATKDTSGIWQTDGETYYWPTESLPGGTESLDFFAYFGNGLTFNRGGFGISSDMPTLSYKVSDNIATQQDVLADQVLYQQYVQSVPIHFSHILSQIIIQAGGKPLSDADIRYTVYEVSLGGLEQLATEGTYAFGEDHWSLGSQRTAAPYDVPVSANIDIINGQDTLTYNWAEGVVIPAGAPSVTFGDVTKDNSYLMLIPQNPDSSEQCNKGVRL